MTTDRVILTEPATTTGNAYPDVPLKCTDDPCSPPGALPKCQLCPISPTYWRLTETSQEAAS